MGDDGQERKKENWEKALEALQKPVEVKETAKEKREKKTEERIVIANGGLQDWVFSAGNLVTELIEVLEEDSFGLYEMLNAAKESAKNLDDELWNKFQEVPRRNVHGVDKDVITNLFSEAEPQWRTLLTTPKKGGVCVFLHVGTEPPTMPICEFLTKLGWFGVVVSPRPPAEGNEDRLQHVELDPNDEDDEPALLKLQNANGSLVPKPSSFALAFADVIWDEENMGSQVNPTHNELWKQMDINLDGKITKKEFRKAVAEGTIGKDIKFKTLDINGDGAVSQFEFVSAMREGLLGEENKAWVESQSNVRPMPSTLIGYGKLGVTMDPGVRSRFRILRNIISVSLSRLANQGTLVITWHGIPHHPALLFLTSQLRPVFLRVHVLVPSGIRSWEVYILAASFKRQEAEEVASKGGGGFMFKNFIDGAYRDQDLDDALLWSLPRKPLAEEYRLGGGEKTIAKGYNELWTEMAAKLRQLAKDISSLEIKESKEQPKKRKPARREGGDAGPKAKAKAKGKAKAKPKAEPAGTAAPGGSAETGASGAASGAAVAPAAPVLPAISKAKVEPKAAAAVQKESTAWDDEEEERVKLKTRLVRHRSLPTLACSLGCSPGVKKGSQQERMGDHAWKIIQRAVGHLESESKIVMRIDRNDIRYAMKQSQTEKFMNSKEGQRWTGLEIVMPPETPETKEQMMKRIKEERKMPPPPVPL